MTTFILNLGQILRSGVQALEFVVWEYHYGWTEKDDRREY
jgi:hypothetical protein